MPLLPPIFSKLFSNSKFSSGPLPDEICRCVEKGTAEDLSCLSLPEAVFFQSASSGTGSPTIWHLAAERGDVGVLQRIHNTYTHLPPSSPLSPNNSRSSLKAFCLPDKQGRTPLMVASQHGHIECAAALITWGATASKERDKRGRLPIHVAAQSGNLDLVQLLLGCSSSVRPTSSHAVAGLPTHTRLSSPTCSDAVSQYSPLRGCQDSVGSDRTSNFTTQEADAPPSPVTPVPPQPHQQKQHAKSAANISEYSRFLAGVADDCGLTPLHYAAASSRSLPVCQILLDCGASLTAVSTAASYDTTLPCNAGMTPLHIAAMSNSFKVVHLLLTVWNNQSVQEKLRHWSPTSNSSAANKRVRSSDEDQPQHQMSSKLQMGSSSLSLAAGGITDPRSILDKERKAAYMLAYARGYKALGELLDPSTPLPGGHTPEGLSPPSNFCCPITMDLMQDPVVASDGYTYERAAIEKWMTSKETSPMSNVAFSYKVVFPNRALRHCINEWRVQNGLPEFPAEPIVQQGQPKQRSSMLGPGLSSGARAGNDGFLEHMSDTNMIGDRRPWRVYANGSSTRM